MGSFRLSTKAESDLGKIAEYTIKQFGILQARKYKDEFIVTFEKLANTPSLGRKYPLAEKVLYRYNHKAHVIFYEEFKGEVTIYRILGSKMDFDRHL